MLSVVNTDTKHTFMHTHRKKQNKTRKLEVMDMI